MATVSFILKHNKTSKYPKRTEETPVLMVFRFGNEQIRVYPGEKVPPKYWITKDCRARETIKFTEGKSINTRLETIEKRVLNAFRDHLNVNGAPLMEKLRDEIQAIVRPKPTREPEKMTFFRAIEEYIRTANKKQRTIFSYKSTLATLKTFSEKLNKELTFDDINIDFYENFTRFLTYEVKHNRKTKEGEEKKTGYTLNTIGTQIKNIKIFMGYAYEKGYTMNATFRNRKFHKVEETADTIYLNDRELKTLYDKNLQDNPKLDRVRDLFLIGCYTGLRFSDLSQLTPEKFIKDGKQLKVKTVKTGETVIIPLHWIIKEIMQKYNGELPRAISNQKMNEYLKELGELAGIDEKITLTHTKGTLSIEKTLPKYKLMTVHTARRSAATNLYLAEVPTLSIMKITGHRTEKAFMKYIKITQEQNADKLQAHPYFIKPLSVVSSK